jgi:Ala-tRNA(Pro) deacylase
MGEEALLAALDAAGVSYTTYRHEPVKNVQEALDAEKSCGLDVVLATRTKNLFLTDKKKVKRWLLTASIDSKVDLKKLGSVIKAQDLKFASDLTELLAVEAGSVTPFAILNDTAPGRVVSILDESIVKSERALAHPMHNAATISVASADLVTFLTQCDHEPIVVRFAPDGACEVVSAPTTGTAALAAAGEATQPTIGSGKDKAPVKPAVAAEARIPLAQKPPSPAARLEAQLLDDLITAIRRGELTPGTGEGADDELRARVSLLMQPHLSSLRNLAYTSGFTAHLVTVPKNPAL